MVKQKTGKTTMHKDTITFIDGKILIYSFVCLWTNKPNQHAKISKDKKRTHTSHKTFAVR